MTTIRRPLALLLLSGILFLCVSARADRLTLPEMFTKCDGLLGESPKAVLAALGQPDVAKVEPLYGLGKQLLFWQYKDRDLEAGTYGYSIKLIFFQDRTLVFVGYDGLNIYGDTHELVNLSGYQDRCKSTLSQIVSTYNRASLKVGYNARQAQANLLPGAASTKVQSYEIILTARTGCNNNFETFCNVEAPNPCVLSHRFDENANVYKDTFSINPDFEIATVFPGDLVLTSSSLTKLKAMPHGSDIYNAIYGYTNPTTALYGPVSPTTAQFIPVTSQNMPFLFNH